MSRTDAHVPFWVRATWYQPVHHIYCENYANRLGRRHRSADPCNLPERAVRHAGRRTRAYVPLCTWEPVWPSWREARYLHVRNVPRWYVQHVWDNAERVRERDGLRDMVKEHRAHRELADGDFPNHQHRHGATWYWD